MSAPWQSQFANGYLTNGTFTNGTFFNGPAQFYCTSRKEILDTTSWGEWIGRDSTMTFLAVLSFIMMMTLAAMFSWAFTWAWVTGKLKKCATDQERTDLVAKWSGVKDVELRGFR